MPRTLTGPTLQTRRRPKYAECSGERYRLLHAVNAPHVRLHEVERVEVTIVMDNFVDVLLAGSEGVRRYVQPDLSDRKQLVAEHGFSALIAVEQGGRRSSVLYDAGLTPDSLARNLDVLQIPVLELRAIVISHGHRDHHGGLEGLFARYG